MAKVKKVVESTDSTEEIVTSEEVVDDGIVEEIKEYATESGMKRATKIRTLNGEVIEQNDYAV